MGGHLTTLIGTVGTKPSPVGIIKEFLKILVCFFVFHHLITSSLSFLFPLISCGDLCPWASSRGEREGEKEEEAPSGLSAYP